MSSYIGFLDNIKAYVYNNRENKRVEKENLPKVIHCDFELALIGAIRQIYPNTEIKLCLWHFFRNIEINRKKIYGDLSNENNISLNLLKRIKTLCYIDPKYVRETFALITEDANNGSDQDKHFAINYFKKT